MKTKLLAALIALLLMSIVTSAQDYAIRVTFNTNLRAAASLQANIIETAASGTTLNVVSELNRWLRIDRNGNEVWMAGWVGHTRVREQLPDTDINAGNEQHRQLLFCGSAMQYRPGMDGRLLGVSEQAMQLRRRKLRHRHQRKAQVRFRLKLITAVLLIGSALLTRNGQTGIGHFRTISVARQHNRRRRPQHSP